MKLTPKQISEPDITLYIPKGADLPDEIRKTLEHFIGTPCIHKKTRKHYTKYVLPAYRVHQWLKEYSHLLKP